MADTGYSGNMAASTEGVDVEIDELIKAVVERGSRRKDALSKRFEGTGPQLLRTMDAEARPEDEINSLMDDIKRNVEARTVDAAPVERKPWIAEAVTAQQAMKAHEDRAQGVSFDPPEPSSETPADQPEQKSGFGINPFGKKVGIAAAAAGAGAVMLGREAEYDDEDIIDAAVEDQSAGDVAPEIAGDVFASELVESDVEADQGETAALAYGAEDDGLVDEADLDDAFIDTRDDDDYAAMLIGEDAPEMDAETPERAPMPAAAMAAQGYQSDDGMRGTPVWLAMGIPVAAVSMAALVAGVHVVREAGAEDVPIEAASLAPMIVSYADTSEPPLETKPVEAIVTPVETDAIILANAPAAVSAPAIAPDPSFDTDTARRAVEAAPVVPSAPVEIIEVTAPVPSLPAEPEPRALASAALPAAPSVKPVLPETRERPINVSAPVPVPSSVAPERASLNHVPSLKPQRASVPRKTTTVRAASPAVFRPSGSVPVRVFDGRFERGSAALVVNSVAANMGGTLDRTQQNWLARDMERALDQELDGRNVSLKSDRGDRIGVLFANSAQELRRMPIARERSVGALPSQMVLEGGWFAARKDAALRPTPSLSGTFRNRIVNKDALIERMATVTDRYGDRWYLMGQRGVAIGYMSPADLVLAGAAEGALGLPFERRLGEAVQDMVPVFTRCRTVFVGPLGSTRQQLDVCRNAKGNWVGATDGQVVLQQAEAPRAEPIVLASATGQSPELRPFETPPVRKALSPKLVYGRAGQVIKQQLADGRDVELTLGAKFETRRTVPVMRLEALGRIDRPVRLDARWMRLPGGARLRATPDYLTEVQDASLPAGSAIETIGTVTDDRGADWVLVGRRGVGFGYVQRQELMPLAGNTSLRAVPSVHTAAVVDLVETVTECRSVDYIGAGLDGTFTACQQPDGQWALSAEPALRQLVDLEPSSRIAP